MTQTNSGAESAPEWPAGNAPASVSSPDKRELVITRILDAPRETVFKVWTDPKHVAQWWGPKWFTNPVCELDVRPGGAIRIDMAGPDGVIYPMTGVFREIVAPERLVFATMALVDEQGEPELEGITTVTFAEHDGKTRLTLHVVMVKATPEAQGALDGMEEGWNQSLDKLAAYLPKARPGSQEGDLPGDLSAPAQRALTGAGIRNLQQLTSMSEAELKRLHGFGPNTIRKLHDALQANGLSFAADKRSKGK